MSTIVQVLIKYCFELENQVEYFGTVAAAIDSKKELSKLAQLECLDTTLKVREWTG
jgi:hypothetical protein